MKVPKVNIINQNCNKALNWLKLSTDHYLTFIDCEGLDVYWSTMKKLLEKPGDIIVLFQTSEIKRVLGKTEETRESLSIFVGEKRKKGGCFT